MAKRIILYNLADNMTHEDFKDYVVNEKGHLIDRLPGVKKYELVKITGSMAGESPYQYAGIVHLDSIKEFDEKRLSVGIGFTYRFFGGSTARAEEVTVASDNLADLGPGRMSDGGEP